MSARVSKLRPIIIAVISIMFFISAAGFFLSLPGALGGHVDFRTFFTVGYMARTGHGAEIYDPAEYQKFQNRLVGPVERLLPFNHLAYESLLYVPFSFVPYRTAYWLFVGTNLLILSAASLLFRPLVAELSEIWRHLPLAIMASFLPVSMALIEGQDSLLLLLLFVATASAWYRQNDFRAGLLLGLSLFKFQYAIPVAALMMVWRRWRLLRGFFLTGGIVVAISVWIAGLSGSAQFVHSVLEVSARYSSSNGVLYGVHPDGMPNLRGLTYMLTGGSVFAGHWITLILSVMVMVWEALKRPTLPGAMLAALLVSYHQVIADTSLLLLPVGLILANNIADLTLRRNRISVLIGCLAVVSPTALLFANTRFYLLALPVAGLFLLWHPPSPIILHDPASVSSIGDRDLGSGGLRRPT